MYKAFKIKEIIYKNRIKSKNHSEKANLLIKNNIMIIEMYMQKS